MALCIKQNWAIQVRITAMKAITQDGDNCSICTDVAIKVFKGSITSDGLADDEIKVRDWLEFHIHSFLLQPTYYFVLLVN